MRKNRTLTAAITTALSLSSWSAYAQFQFENVGPTANSRALTAIMANGEQGLTSGSSTVAVPNAGFDFTGGETTISVPTDGVPFAAELFGGTGLTLPTVLSTGATGSYMAVVYTIDGQITQNFNMTFTLDNGATFAENPILGVKDKKGSGGGNVQAAIPSGATSVVVDQTGFSAGEVFRFTDHATIYQVSAAPTTGGGQSTISFIQLGTASAGATAGTVSTISRIYKGSQLGSSPTLAVAGLNLTTVRTAPPTSGQKSLAVVNGAAFTSGWSYICGTPSTTGQSIFQVTGITDSSTTTGMISVSTVSTGSGVQLYNSGNTTGGLLTTDCVSTTVSISRIHLPGDTVISLNATGSAITANKLIQFGVVSASPGPFNNTAQYTVSAVDTIKNTITISSLGTILLGTEPLYDANISTGDTWVAANTAAGVPKTATAAGTNKAIFTLNAGTTTPNLNLATNDQVMLLYKLSNVGALAAAGQKVNMQVDLRTGGVVDVLVNPQRSVTVATSVKGTEVSLTSIEAGKLNIAVSTGSTQFSGEMSPLSSVPYGYVSNTVANIGSITVKDGQNNALMENGVYPFKIKGTTAVTVLTDNSKLKVTGGQFQASRNSPGKVFINATSSTGSQSNISADFVTQDSAGDWSAIWNLDSTEMASIAAASPMAYISIQTDGVAEVNTVENAPHGAFTIDFNNAAYKDITVEGDLRKISKDGTVCTVYQIPQPADPESIGPDLMSIRITNDSSIAAMVTGTLYDMDGNLLGTANTPLATKELPAGATLRIDSDKLSGIFGGATWKGRAVLKITSIMPQMEVMALIRQRGIPFAPLSNLSAGAKGTSCQ